MYFQLIAIIVFVVVATVCAIVRTVKSFSKSSHEAKIMEMAKKRNLIYRPYFAKPMNDAGQWPCFMKFKEPSFSNVLEFENDYKGALYIGELEFTAHEVNMSKVASSCLSSRGSRYGSTRSTYQYGMGNDVRAEKFKNELTMCVIYDKGMMLPYFDMMPETIKLKAFELFGMNDSTDIDFQNDKEFSDAWWLSGQSDSEIRNLFTTMIRSGFMRFAEKGYRICGRSKMIIVIADKLIEPEKMNSVIADMRAIQKILQRNPKYYTAVPEPREDDIENQPPANPTEFMV